MVINKIIAFTNVCYAKCVNNIIIAVKLLNKKLDIIDFLELANKKIYTF